MSYQVINPFIQFVDPINGKPLSAGSVYFGRIDSDPKNQPANRINVYAVQDNGAEVLLAQPITLNGAGQPQYSGSVKQIKVELYEGESAYAIQLFSKNGSQKGYSPRVGSMVDVAALAADNSAVSVAGVLAKDLARRYKESISLTDYENLVISDNWTIAAQAAIDDAVAIGKSLHIPAGEYKIIPATPMEWEGTRFGEGTILAALLLRSKLEIIADIGARFKIADGVSTNLAPKRMAMFFTNVPLDNVHIDGLTMDMNGANNPISPSRPTTYNKFQQAHIHVTGTIDGVAARIDNCTIQNCRFVNTPGVTCIGMAQSNSAGVILGRAWRVVNNTFYNNGYDTDDHSSIFGWANDVVVTGNIFSNPTMFNATTRTGGLVAYEVHGSNTIFSGNVIDNYYQGLWLGINLTETTRNVNVFGNSAKVGCCFTDFYSANLGAPPYLDLLIQGVNIYGNAIDITGDPVADQVKSFFRIAARKQPTMVNIYGNVCRSFEATKNTVLSNIVVLTNQLESPNFINIYNNTAAGISCGLVVYFGDAFNVGEVSFENNKLGNLVPSAVGLFPNVDTYLYGPSAGRVTSLRVKGLQSPTSPVATDGAAGGRATVYGSAILDLPVSWTGVTIGNGTYFKKIALDTDAGHAILDIGFNAGSTSVFAGSITPVISGITADSNSTAAAVHIKSGSALPVASYVFNTGNAVSLYNANGTLFDSVNLAADSLLHVNCNFPCRSANI